MIASCLVPLWKWNPTIAATKKQKILLDILLHFSHEKKIQFQVMQTKIHSQLIVGCQWLGHSDIQIEMTLQTINNINIYHKCIVIYIHIPSYTQKIIIIITIIIWWIDRYFRLWNMNMNRIQCQKQWNVSCSYLSIHIAFWCKEKM